MRITVLGSLGHIGQHLVPLLVARGHEVRVVAHAQRRAAAIEALGAIPVIGDIADVAFLTDAFTDADAVFTMLAGGGMTADIYAEATAQARTFRTAITAAGVQNVVQLSSIGADQGSEVGPLHAYKLVEQEMRKLADVNLAFVRPVGFYDNLLTFIPQLQQTHTLAINIPGSTRRAWAAPADIALVVAELLAHTPAGITTRYVVSDFASGNDLIALFRDTLKITDLQYVELSDADYRSGALALGLPSAIVDGMVRMSQAQRNADRFYADLDAHMPVLGTTKLREYMPTFAAAYTGGTTGTSAPFA